MCTFSVTGAFSAPRFGGGFRSLFFSTSVSRTSESGRILEVRNGLDGSQLKGKGAHGEEPGFHNISECNRVFFEYARLAADSGKIIRGAVFFILVWR